MDIKKRLYLSLIWLFISTTVGAIGAPIGYVQISTGTLPPQAGGFNVSSAAINTQLKTNYISGSQCLQSVGGIVSGAGSLCNSGGSFINNQETLQTGATFYISSGTVAGGFTATGRVQLGTPTNINQTANGSITSELDFTQRNLTYGSLRQRYYSASSFATPLVIDETSPTDGTAFSQVYLDSAHGFSVVGGTNTPNLFTVTTVLGGSNYLTVSSGGIITGANVTVSSNTLLPNASFYFAAPVVFSTSIAFIPGNYGVIGETDNSDPNASVVGYYVSTTTPLIPVGIAGNYFDVISTGIPAGDWFLTAFIEIDGNGATFTSSDLEIGISQTAGNTGTGLSAGVNWSYQKLPFTGQENIALMIPRWRLKTTATTTIVYLKMVVGSYTVATPNVAGNLIINRRR